MLGITNHRKLDHLDAFIFDIVRIFSEIDGPLDFNEILVNGSVLNVISMDNISFWRKSIFKKLSAFKYIYFVCNSEENETFIFHIYCMIQKTF